MFDFVGVGVLLVLLVLFAWLTRRAWRARNKALKWVGVVLSGLLTLIFALATGLALKSFYQLNVTHSNPVANLKVAGTPEQLARGEKLAHACVGCHSSNGQLPLAGRNFSEDGPPLGRLYATNLTPTGETKDWTDGEIIRAIREGIHKNGRSLVFMPSASFHEMSDADVQAIVAYLRSQPAVEPNTPPTQISLVGALFLNLAPLLSAQPPIAGPVVAPPEGVTPEYGQYLVASISGCRDCHGDNLAGRLPGNGPPAGPNLTNTGHTWSEADFIKSIRTGVKPDGRAFSQEMPWQEISATLSDNDLKAIFAYLKTLTPLPGPTQ